MSAEHRAEPATWIRDLQARTTGPVKVQLSPDIGVDFPVEVFIEHGPGYVGQGALGLSGALQEDLTRWQRWWEDHVDLGGDDTDGTDEEWRAWNEEGARLLERLRRELGPGFEVRLM